MMQNILKYLKVYIKALRDPRTPKLAKVVILIGLLYVLLPFDILPDAIPILGQVDDLCILIASIIDALTRIPPEVIREKLAQQNNKKNK
jgi:uncharacterized membrane protein YkvA (DUF1232 family)